MTRATRDMLKWKFVIEVVAAVVGLRRRRLRLFLLRHRLDVAAPRAANLIDANAVDQVAPHCHPLDDKRELRSGSMIRLFSEDVSDRIVVGDVAHERLGVLEREELSITLARPMRDHIRQEKIAGLNSYVTDR